MCRTRLSIDKCHPLVKRMFQILHAHGFTYKQVEQRSGVNHTALTYWKHRSMPTLGTFEAVLGALGYELVIRQRRP